jgi:hypothetical protein
MNRLLQKNMVGALSLVLGLLVLPSFAQATAIVGGNLVVQNTGDVSVTFGGSSADYVSTLYFNDTALFTSNSGPGSISLGNFAAGTELVFRLEVQNTGETFYTGTGINTAVENLGEGSSRVGFEDVAGGGDRDYNDLVFDFTNTAATSTGGSQTNGGNIANPEPSTIILFGSGLLGLGAWRLRKKKA